MVFRLAICVHRIGPYHRARLLAASAGKLAIAVEFFSKDQTYLWETIGEIPGLERRILFPRSDSHSHPVGEVRRRVFEVLGKVAPDVVAVPGWSDPGALAATEWCAETQTPIVIMSDSSPYGLRPTRWKDQLKRRLVRLYGAGLVAGSPQAEYLVRLGMQEDRVRRGYDVIDNDYFEREADAARDHADAIRIRLNVPERYFLTVSRFTEGKNLPHFVRTYDAYRRLAGSNAWHLVLVGDGGLRGRLEAMRERLDLRTHLHMPGFSQYDQLPAFYGLAGAFILPSSHETWGLVVNEAMASGLPVLVSRRCGCVPDFVQEGVNGYSFDPSDRAQLVDLMRRISHQQPGLRRMGLRGREIISKWSPHLFAKSVWEAAQIAMSAPRPKFGLIDRTMLWTLMHR